MSIDVRRRGWVQVVEVSGDDSVRGRIEVLLDKGGSLIIADLTKKTDLDSAVLGQLIACREHARKYGAVIKLILTASQCKHIVAAKLDQLFETFRDEEEALDSFHSWDTTVGIP